MSVVLSASRITGCCEKNSICFVRWALGVLCKRECGPREIKGLFVQVNEVLFI